MTALFPLWLFLTISLFFNVLIDSSDSQQEAREKYAGKKLIIILLDGFRWDYLHRNGLEGFNRIKREGVNAEYMEPIFPTLSYPNYYAIATGRYSESHGVTLNDMWDGETKQAWKPLSSDSSQSHWWEDAEPVWTTATKAGLITDMYLWVGCDATIFGTRPTSCVPYTMRFFLDDFEHDLYDVTAKMEKDSSDFGFVYCEQPDLFGHLFGPESFLVDTMVRQLDGIFSRYLLSLDSRGLRDKINVIILSDHGMTDVDDTYVEKINLFGYLSTENVDKIIGHGPIIGIFPKEGKIDEVIREVSQIYGTTMWKSEDLPERHHFRSDNTPPIILLAKRHYTITNLPLESTDFSLNAAFADYFLSGNHGYDAKGFMDMMGIFLAFGPDFKTGHQSKGIKTVDVYNLAMTLIGLEPKDNNGTWDSVVGFLRCPSKTCEGQ